MMDEQLSVIVVDDEILVREELALFHWEKCGMRLLADASNGQEAMELCRKLTPNIVITDITMPVMDGLTFLKALKSEFPSIQVIILTCHSDFDFAHKAISLGALGYILKSTIEPDKIEEALKKARANIEQIRLSDKARGEKARREQFKHFAKLLELPGESMEAFFGNLQSSGVDVSLPLRTAGLCISFRQQDWAPLHFEAENYLSGLKTPVWWTPGTLGRYYLFFRETDAASLVELGEDIAYGFEKRLNKALPHLRDEVKIIFICGPLVNHYDEIKEVCMSSGIWNDYLFHHTEGRVIEWESGSHPQIRLAKKVISAKLKEPLSLRIVAADIGISPNYLSRLFAENTNEGFHEYVIRKRMERAMFLLKSSNLKIYEVAEQVGIPSYRHFSQLFKEWKGMGPKEFKSNG